MRISPEQARVLLPQIDPARLLAGWPVGLRDGALLALFSVGLTAGEIAHLSASAVSMERGGLHVTVQRHHHPWSVALSTDPGARLLAWLTEHRIWGTTEPVLTGYQQPLSESAVHKILYRYQDLSAPNRRRKP